MSTNTQADNRTVGQGGEELHEQIQRLTERVERVEADNAELRDELERAEAERDDLREHVEEQDETIDELRDRADRAEDSRGHIISDIVDVEGRIEDLEGRFEGKTPTFEGGESSSPDLYTPESPLEQITNLPEHMVDKELSSNQERARFIARDVADYGDMRLGEWVLSTGDIRKVLAAKEGRTIHWQTVKRVVEFLDDLGGEDVRVKDKHGTIVCFDPEAAKRYGTQQDDLTPVVSGGKGEV